MNVEIVAKHHPTLPDETSYRCKLALNLTDMALTRKRKAVVAFMILELLEDPNDRVKRGKTREWLEERAEKGMFQTVIKLSLQDTPAFKDMIQLPNPFKLASFPFWLSAAGSSSIATTRS